MNMKDKPKDRVMPNIKIKAGKNTTRKIFSYQNKDDNEDSEKGELEFFDNTSERYFDDYQNESHIEEESGVKAG